jgi:hypothetical protein
MHFRFVVASGKQLVSKRATTRLRAGWTVMDMMKHDWKVVFPPPKCRIVRSRTFPPWQICGKFLAAAFFLGSRAATSPSRLCRRENLRNPLCHQFAARLVGAVNVRPGRFRPTRLKPFPPFGILRRPVRRSRSAPSRMRRKYFYRRRISRAPWAGCLPTGSSASRRRLFRLVRALRGRELPSVCRNAPEVCRKTRRYIAKFGATFRGTQVKPFN